MTIPFNKYQDFTQYEESSITGLSREYSQIAGDSGNQRDYGRLRGLNLNDL